MGATPPSSHSVRLVWRRAPTPRLRRGKAYVIARHDSKRVSPNAVTRPNGHAAVATTWVTASMASVRLFSWTTPSGRAGAILTGGRRLQTNACRADSACSRSRWTASRSTISSSMTSPPWCCRTARWPTIYSVSPSCRGCGDSNIPRASSFSNSKIHHSGTGQRACPPLEMMATQPFPPPIV